MRLSREDLYEKFKTKVLPAPTITATAVDIMLDIAMMEIAKLEADVADRELWKQRAIDAEMDVAKFQRTCPVQAECLDWALDNNEWGHWGNVSERKRKQMRRKLKEARR